MANSYDEDLKIGDRIAGRYEILDVVGHGSMGVVYKCRHDILGRIVAIKTLRLRERTSDDRSQKRFEREARLASRLDHPNLISVHDFGYTAAGDPYLVMDFVSGQALIEIMKRERWLIAERVVHLYSQVCDGLFHAHQRGVIHRDLKPANMLVVKNENGPETVKIVDLGVAKIVQGEEDAEAITMTGEVCGSPIYLSPEQCTYQELDPRTDIYSLGVCLYESLMGVPPLRGSSVYDTIYMHVHEMPRPFAAVPGGNPDVPKRLEEVVFRCLAKQANDRYETMLQVKQELIASLTVQREANAVKVLPPELLFGNAPPESGWQNPEVPGRKSYSDLPRAGYPEVPGRSTHGDLPKAGKDYPEPPGRKTYNELARTGKDYPEPPGRKTYNELPRSGKDYPEPPGRKTYNELPKQDHLGEAPRPGKKISGELSKPQAFVESPSRPAGEGRGQAKRAGASPAAKAPAGKRPRTPERRSAPERNQQEVSSISEKLSLRKMLILASCGSVLFGLSLGFGFAYFLSQHNQPALTAFPVPAPTTPTKDPETTSTVQQGKPSDSTTPRPSDSTTLKPGQSKNGSLGGRKHKIVPVSDLSKLLPDENPINGQGSQNRYFSSFKNAPGVRNAPGLRNGRNPLLASNAPGYRSSQALQNLKENPIIEKMKQFAASQGMPLSGAPPQNQGGPNPFSGPPQTQMPPLRQPPQSSSPDFLHGGGLLPQQPEAHQQSANPERAAALSNEATQLSQNKQFGAACQKFEEAHKLDPGNHEIKSLYAWALNSYALDLNKQQHYGEAVEYSKRAVALAPDKELYHKNLHNFSQNLEGQRSGTLP